MPAVVEAAAVADRPLCVTYLPLAALTPDPRNARTHPPRQVAQIAASIRALGFASPILIDAERNVIAGHGRLLAARAIGMRDVPTIALTGLSDAQKRALRLADNRIALGSGWDQGLLRLELGELAAMNFDVSLTGFSAGEIARAKTARVRTAADSGAAATRPRVRQGEIWEVGGHRLGCGDWRDAAFVRAVVGEGAVTVSFLDPRAAAPGADADAPAWLGACLSASAAVSCQGAVHFLCCDWRALGAVRAAGDATYGAPLNLCVWTGGAARDGSPYRSRHVLVLVYRTGDGDAGAPGAGRRGACRSDVWEHAPDRIARRGQGTKADKAVPPALPIALISDAIADGTPADALVLDLFPGSGATLIAAERSGRRLRAIDPDPAQIDAAIDRWIGCTGGTATRVTGVAA